MEMNNKITERLIELTSQKDTSSIRKWIEKSQLKVLNRDKDMADYRTHTSRSVSEQQKADILHNNPIFDFIGLDKEGRRNTFTFKELWKYWWKIDETDSKIISVVDDLADLGSGFLYLGWKNEWRNINVPKYNKDTKRIEYVEDNVEWYCGPYSEHIPVENIFLDGLDVESSNELIIARFYDRQEWENKYELNEEYGSLEGISSFEEYINEFKDIPQLKEANPNIVLELSYYNESNDEYIVEVNGKTVLETHIPHLHKTLPVAKADNHLYRDRLLQMGNYELLEESENYIDAVRSQSIDVTKANIGFTVMTKDSAYRMKQIGPYAVMEVDEEDLSQIRHFGNNIQPSQLSGLENKGGDDVAMLSGVNHRDQLFGASSETAKKTNSRNEAQTKRTNLLLKRNSFKFYNRLAKLRINDIQLVASFGEKTIDIKGKTETKDGLFKNIGQNSYGTFTVKPKMAEGKVNVILQTESLLGNSTEKELENFLNFFQVFGNSADENGKQIINIENAIRIAGTKFNIDVDELLASNIENKNGEQLIAELDAEMAGQNINALDESNPNFIPGANRANDSGGINVIGGGNTNGIQ